MRRPPAALVLAAFLLTGCAASRAPATGFAEPEAVERAVMTYYARHATEENDTCLSPYMYGVTRIDVVEEQPERLVVDVRYLYRDRTRDDQDGLGRDCSAYGERRFTLGKDAEQIEVLDMTGPQRAAGTA